MRKSTLATVCSIGWVCVAASAKVARAEIVTAGPGDDIESIINALSPGDELVLEGGMYVLDESRFGVSVAGTAAMPIVIRAADAARPHFHRPNETQNIWDISAEFLVIRGIEFSGGSAGLRFQSGRDVTIEDCEIHDTGDVALRMNDGGTYDRMRILRNHIHHTNGTGEGMYLGCNSNGCRIANSLIEGNYVHHTNQASVEQGDGIEIKEGSYGNIVRDNVIHDTNYPCILTYATVGEGPPNVIERNLLWNCGDNAIQSAADAIIRNNIILGAGGDGIAMQPHQAGTPSNLVVVHNTILNAGTVISLRGATGSVTIANNALYSEGGEAIFTNGDVSMLTSVGNVGVGGGPGVSVGDLAADLVMASFAGAPPMNVFPAAGGSLVGAGVVAHVVADDFDGTPRMGVADVGAYAFASGAPRWPLGEGFRGVGPIGSDGGMPLPGTDAAMPGPGGDGGGRDGGGVGGDGGRAGGDGGSTGPTPPAGGGCGCVVVGGWTRSAGLPWLAAIAWVGCALRRTRRRR